ncbi:hypothetical protein Hanom_Chr11g01023401 [Helianthus anomalus]
MSHTLEFSSASSFSFLDSSTTFSIWLSWYKRASLADRSRSNFLPSAASISSKAAAILISNALCI